MLSVGTWKTQIYPVHERFEASAGAVPSSVALEF